MTDKNPDKSEEPLASGSRHSFKELKSSGDAWKTPLEFKAEIIPYEGYVDGSSPLLAFSGSNVNIIFSIPRENFRKLAAAVFDHMDDSMQSKEINSVDLSNASNSDSSNKTSKECNLNAAKDFDNNTNEVLDSHKDQANVDGESVENIRSSDTTNRPSDFRSTSTVSATDHTSTNHSVSNKHQGSMHHDVDETQCTEDSKKFNENLSNENELQCSEMNDSTGDVEGCEDISGQVENIKTSFESEHLVKDVQNESVDQNTDLHCISESHDNIDIKNLSAHTLDDSFGSCPDLESAWPDINLFTQTGIIPLSEIKSCESAGVQTKYYKLEFPHELVILRVSFEENTLSLEAARYKESSMNSGNAKSKDLSLSDETALSRSRHSSENSNTSKQSDDKLESEIFSKSDFSNHEDEVEAKDVEIMPQVENEVSLNTNPEELEKNERSVAEAMDNIESGSSLSKYRYKEHEYQTMKQSENKRAVKSKSTEKKKSLPKNAEEAVLEIINLERSLVAKVDKIRRLMQDISAKGTANGDVSSVEASSSEMTEVQSTKIIYDQKEQVLESTNSGKFSTEFGISKDEPECLIESEMDGETSTQSVTPGKQPEECSNAVLSSEGVLLNAAMLSRDSVSPIRHSRRFVDSENVKSPDRAVSEPESIEVSSSAEKEQAVYISVSTPRNKPPQDYDEKEQLKASKADPENNLSSPKVIPVHCSNAQEKDEDSIAPSKTETAAPEKSSVSEKNASSISDVEEIQENEKDSEERIESQNVDAKEQLKDEKDSENKFTKNLENGSVIKVVPEEEKEKTGIESVGSKLFEISFSEGSEQVSDEDVKGCSFENTLASSLENKSVNETLLKEEEETDISSMEREISKSTLTDRVEKTHKDGNCTADTFSEDLKNEIVEKSLLEEEETETVENISAECLEDIIEEIENKSLKTVCENKDESSKNYEESENEKSVSGECEVNNETIKKNEIIVRDTNDHAVLESSTNDSDSLTGPTSLVTSDSDPSLQASHLNSFTNLENTKDGETATLDKSFENKSSDLVVEENGISESSDSMKEGCPKDSSDGVLHNTESVECRPENSHSEETVMKDSKDIDERASADFGDKTIESHVEITSEPDILESDDSKSIASESDDSRDSGRSAFKKRGDTSKSDNDEVDCAPTRVRTRKAPSGLSEDVIPENSTVTKNAKSSKARGLTTHRSSKPTEKVSPNARSLRSKSLDPSPQSNKVSTRDKKHNVTEAEEGARLKRATTPEVIKKDLKIAVRSSPRKLTRANATNPESSASSKVQSTRVGGADSQVKTRSNLETSMSLRRTKRGQ